METELANHLLTLSDRYCAAESLSESTVGRLCAADGRFFPRIREGKTFTAKKYDEVVGWFSKNWPSGAEWPVAVSRPRISEAAQ
ncbi:hypothetical protein [Sinorhizobium meliloti]|uniref:hypothetical protein n=1 Tax=Rhizobium meliloti TaxID=382 RepID=UPI000FDB1A97|nr:hypothetical protein [Sinorhizobium meliloti]RVO24776.1 hypothetical protein CN095_31260 [Sinorhizobium meliloti]